jgi:hypothetical protein
MVGHTTTSQADKGAQTRADVHVMNALVLMTQGCAWCAYRGPARIICFIGITLSSSFIIQLIAITPLVSISLNVIDCDDADDQTG